jgi:hypothetical protein
MAERFRWRRGRNGARRPRSRAVGCLWWVVGLIIVLIVLSLLFGGFQKGTKADGPGAPRPVQTHAPR